MADGRPYFTASVRKHHTGEWVVHLQPGLENVQVQLLFVPSLVKTICSQVFLF